MLETLIKLGGHSYSIGRLNAFDQLHVSRKIAPIVPHLMPILSELAKGEFSKTLEAIDQANAKPEGEESETSDLIDLKDVELGGLDGLAKAFTPMMDALATMPEQDVNYVLFKCLGVCKRDGSPMCRGQTLMFDDLDMSQMLPLVIAVIRINLGNFIQGMLTKASNMKQA